MTSEVSIKGKHGGKRRGAGRPRARFRPDAPHRSRAKFDRRSPIHVTMRGRCWIFGLRSERVFAVLRQVLALYVAYDDFRIVHISIQDNHLHLIVEADNDKALDRRMRSFTINAARAINATCGSSGQVFHRYHSSVIRTRGYARHVIAYVLGNWRRHKQDFLNGWFSTAAIDRYSSAISFDGWNQQFIVPADYSPLPVSPPRTWLMRDGWAFDGPLDPFHAPGPLW
jgi:REP element-mobilizing transposase RayT